MAKKVFFIAPYGEVDECIFHSVFNKLHGNRLNFDFLTEYHFNIDTFIYEIKSPLIYGSASHFECESNARSLLGDSLFESILSYVSMNEL